jgi:hypothetical protein
VWGAPELIYGVPTPYTLFIGDIAQHPRQTI